MLSLFLLDDAEIIGRVLLREDKEKDEEDMVGT